MNEIRARRGFPVNEPCQSAVSSLVEAAIYIPPVPAPVQAVLRESPKRRPFLADRDRRNIVVDTPTPFRLTLRFKARRNFPIKPRTRASILLNPPYFWTIYSMNPISEEGSQRFYGIFDEERI